MAQPLSLAVPAGSKYLRSDQGIDFLSPGPVRAIAAGVVSAISSGWQGGSGKGVYVTFDTPVTVYGRSYSQMYSAESVPLVKVGQKVGAGDPIASPGSVEVGFWPSPLVGGTGAGTKVNLQALDFGSFLSGLGLKLPSSAVAPSIGGGGGITGAVTGAAKGLADSSVFGVSPAGVFGAGKSVVDTTVATGKFLGKLSDPNYILRGLQMIAGAVLVFAGLFLLAKQVGLAASAPGPIGAVAGAVG